MNIFNHLQKTSIFVILFLGTALQLHAFEGWEHEGLGNIALAANAQALKEILRSPPLGIDTNVMKKAWEMLVVFQNGVSFNTNKPPVTYGSIVRLVDYMKDNYALMHMRDTGSGWPVSPTNTDIGYLQTLSSDHQATLAGASHANQDHFQGRALYTFWFWHRQAVETASSGNLWGALLLNAYADHFLQDSFAPGHVIAPRDENSHDLYAVIIHDSYNIHGMIYRVGKPQQCYAALSKLLPLAKSSAFDRLEKQRVRLDSSAIHGLLGANEATNVMCYGDGLINQNPSQAALVSAYCVQSLSDVIDSFLKSTSCNSFGNYRWNLRFGGSKVGQLEMIDVWQSFGNLTCVDRELDESVKTREMRVYVAGTNGPPLRSHLPEIDADIVAPLSIAAARNPAFGVTLGMQDLSESSGSHLQSLVEAEVMIAGGRWDYLRQDFPTLYLPSWPSQFGLTLGYSGLFDTTSHANGVMTRLILPVPKINAQVSLYAGGRYYSGNSVSEWGAFEGIRAEWGMHMGNLFFGVGHDHYPRKGGQLVDGVSLEAGISFAIPWSRVPKFW